MRPDGFRGMAVLITAEQIVGKTTNDLLTEFLAAAGLEHDAEYNSFSKRIVHLRWIFSSGNSLLTSINETTWSYIWQ